MLYNSCLLDVICYIDRKKNCVEMVERGLDYWLDILVVVIYFMVVLVVGLWVC